MPVKVLKLKKLIMLIFAISLTGCPVETEADCIVIMKCSDDRESLCTEDPVTGCLECDYYINETCWEECVPIGRMNDA